MVGAGVLCVLALPCTGRSARPPEPIEGIYRRNYYEVARGNEDRGGLPPRSNSYPQEHAFAGML
jgi:hypothetical protein